jgi:hypothetical protein
MEQAQNRLKKKLPNREAVSKVVRFKFMEFDDEAREHVIDGCENLTRFFTGEIPHLGDFLTAVVKNDLHEAFARADETNIKHMWTYLCFLHNEVPISLVHLAREKK